MYLIKSVDLKVGILTFSTLWFLGLVFYGIIRKKFLISLIMLLGTLASSSLLARLLVYRYPSRFRYLFPNIDFYASLFSILFIGAGLIYAALTRKLD